MFKVMIQVAAKTFFDDPISGEYDGISYSTKEEAQKVSIEALEKYPDLEWSWVEEV